MSETTAATRSHETEITIQAPSAAVWKALTDADELVRWFPRSARVEPGVGGSIHLSWGGDLEGTLAIDVWEPPTRLRTSWLAPHGATGVDPDEATGVAVEYTIEARGGACLLRVVHSGFGTGAAWDREYDGTRRGWKQELFGLRLYLEHHLGQDRSMAWARAPIGMPVDAAWERIMSPAGLVAAGTLDGLCAGDRFAITTAAGDRLEGTVALNAAPDFAGLLTNWEDAYFRIAIEDCFGAVEAHVWVSSWGRPAAEAEGLERRCQDLLTGLFPG